MPELPAHPSIPDPPHPDGADRGPRPGDPVLTGRDTELAAVLAVLEQDPGRGAFVLVHGEPGSGKSALLREVLGRARGQGATVLSAGTDPLESGVEFGVVRQLFEHAVLAATAVDGAGGADALLAGPAAPAAAALAAGASGTAAGASAPAGTGAPAAGPAMATLHGLYWLAAKLAARGRLVLAVDDLQWADRASLLWLQCLLRRADDLPVVVIATLGPMAAPPDTDVLSRVVALFRHRLALAPLDGAAVAEVVEQVLGAAGDEPFRAAVRAATGGNPFLLHSLLRSIAAAGAAPDAATAARLTGFVPAEVGRAVRALVKAVGGQAQVVAQTAAVLGGAPAPDLVASVTGLPEPAVQDAVHALERAGLMAGAEEAAAFACPMIAVAVANEVLPSTRQQVHARAAELLLAQGAPAEQVAAHALHAPLGLAWAPELLCRAAAEAVRRGAPEEAGTLFRRALREPLDDGARATVLIGLGEAGLASSVPTAVDHLRQGLDLSHDPAERTAAARRLAGALFALDRYPDGLDLLGHTAESLRESDPARALRLEIDLIYAGLHEAASAPAVLPRLMDLRISDAAGTPVERPLAALLALRAIMRGESPAEAVALARVALSHGMNPPDDESFVYSGAVLFLGSAGETELALDHADAAVAQARERGSAFTLAHSSIIRACVYGQLGRVLDCQADAEAALRTLREIGVDPGHAHSVLAAAALTDALLKQGRVEEAEALLERSGLSAELNGHWITDYVHLVRGQLRAAQGRPAEAIADFRACGERTEARGLRCPWIYPWRSEAALVRLALGEREAARTLAEEELALARRWGVPEAIGAAGRALALATGGPEGLDLLREAVRTLDGTPARYRHAQALGDLGAQLRRSGRVAEARAHLKEAVTAAHRLGAAQVADRALEELRAAGDRPRTRTFQGVAALTPSERRVAVLAAKGMSNREIAQHLFVGLRTVEVHLTNGYGKLGIDGRPGLVEALAPAGGA
ncbi:AAA family ATPase [Kitasatospora sp. NPDC049258]|uniref:ATP-binding protein n=1 Tax=Kitasatospora sp. NPDC049258 TaxID=3155394 RepID=UPI0034477332